MRGKEGGRDMKLQLVGGLYTYTSTFEELDLKTFMYIRFKFFSLNVSHQGN